MNTVTIYKTAKHDRGQRVLSAILMANDDLRSCIGWISADNFEIWLVPPVKITYQRIREIKSFAKGFDSGFDACLAAIDASIGKA